MPAPRGLNKLVTVFQGSLKLMMSALMSAAMLASTTFAALGLAEDSKITPGPAANSLTQAASANLAELETRLERQQKGKSPNSVWRWRNRRNAG
jgi:hypothetical protein